MKIISETTQTGLLEINKIFRDNVISDVSIQTSEDGRIWINVNGMSFIRFKPLSAMYLDTEAK